MNTRSFSHLGDGDLLRRLKAEIGQDRATTATLLALIAEVDDRRLYLPAGFPSMFAYCVQVLRMSEDTAFKRIRAARTARQFPAILSAVAEGRLHLTAVVFLAPHLTPENAGELLAAATHKTKAEIERLLAERFPRPDLPERVLAVSPPSTPAARGNVQELPRQLVPEPVGSGAPWPKVTPLSPERVALQVTIDRSTCEKLRYAQALLGHQLAGAEIPAVLDRALDALIGQLEKCKFAATDRPRERRLGSSENPRHIPAHVKRTVWERDGGQCTFVSDRGQRCPARTRLEYDHVDPVARGGESTVEGVRIRCRAHNQYEAECVFGAGFMSGKREAAQRAAEVRRQEAAARAEEKARRKQAEVERRAPDAKARAEEEARREEAAAKARAEEQARRRQAEAERRAAEARARAATEEIVTPLRLLGCWADEARRIAATCAAIPDAPLEERLRFAIKQLAPRHSCVGDVS